MLFSWKNPLKALPVLLLFAAYAGAALGAAGNVQFVIGDVKLITKAGVTKALQKGAEINEGDRIVSASGGSAQLKMVDGGFIAIRPNTDMTFDTYRYSGKEDGNENAVVSLLQGGFRTITGAIGRTNKQNYLIKTETSTIGIRGTDHEPQVILPPPPGQPPAIAEPGSYDKVNVGVAFIKNDAGSVDIQPNQVGFAPATKAAPVILPKIPPFYKPTPEPVAQKAKEETKEGGKQESAAATGGQASAAAPAESTGQIRDTAVVDPASAAVSAPAAAPIASAPVAAQPAAVAPVVALTATGVAGSTLDLTGSTVTGPGGTTVPVSSVPALLSSPIVASNNYDFGNLALKPVAGGYERIDHTTFTPFPNTNFIFSTLGLVEMVNVPYERYGINYDAQAPIANANLKYSGGVAADRAADLNGTYYLGRWTGGQIDVKDLATTSPVAPFTDQLGATSAHWVVGLVPGNIAGPPLINAVQQIVGKADYTLLAATHPTDAFGNVGTLNSATLAANFSAQTVNAGLNLSFSSADPVNISARNLNLTATANNVPIRGAGFDANGQFQPSVTCSGADCAPSGYLGHIGGRFLSTAAGGTTTGAVGTGVGIGYGFAPDAPSPAASQPFTDFIQGVAVLSTASTPTPGTAPVPVSGGTGTYRHYLFGVQPVGSTTYNSVYSTAAGAALPAQNYLFDAAGNLVRIQGAANYNLSERGTSGPPTFTTGAPVPYTGTPGGLPSSPLAGASVSFSGGATPDGNYNDTVNGIRLGRYAGGTIVTTDLSNASNPITYFTQLGANSYNWSLREMPASIPVTGSFEYSAPTYSTKPTDSLGNVGTVNYATLAADFTKQTVSPAVGITINNQNLSSAATNVPISSAFSFDVSSSAAQNSAGGGALQVSCFGSNCAPAAPSTGSTRSYGGRITGGFAGSGTAGGAFFRYDFNTRYVPGDASDLAAAAGRPINDYIEGLVAFTKSTAVLAPAPATASSGNQAIITSYFTNPGSYYKPSMNSYQTSPTSYTIPFGAGSTNTVSDYAPLDPTPQSETLTGGTVATAPTPANSAAATGISFGRYTGGTISGIDWAGNSFSVANAGSYAWIKGPETFPMYLQGGLIGTATYVRDGNTPPTATNGSTGTLNSANLAVNFNSSSVGVDLSVALGGSTYAATTTPPGVTTCTGPCTSVRLDSGLFFDAANWNNSNPALHKSLYVTKNGSAGSLDGWVMGQLMGPGLNGAGVTYGFQDYSVPTPGVGVNGAVAFALSSYNNGTTTTTGTTAIDPNNVPYVLGLLATGLAADPTANPAYAPASIDNDWLAQINGGFNAYFRMSRDANGIPTRWDGEFPISIPQGPPCTLPCTPSPAYVTQVPVRLSINPADFGTGTGQVALPTGKSPATLLESGRDPVTGISWGRYGGGMLAVFDRVGGGFPAKLVDLTAQNWHGIFSPLQSGPTVLPSTGTFNYTSVGGTKPTDNLGSAAGTLNAATLVADFGAQKVNAGVNLTVNGTTWAAGANGIPIQNRLYFETGKDSSGGPMNVCVGTTCGTVTIPTTSSANTAGRIVGGFTGTSGQGLGMAYSLNQGGVTGTTVSGVTAFKR